MANISYAVMLPDAVMVFETKEMRFAATSSILNTFSEYDHHRPPTDALQYQRSQSNRLIFLAIEAAAKPRKSMSAVKLTPSTQFWDFT